MCFTQPTIDYCMGNRVDMCINVLSWRHVQSPTDVTFRFEFHPPLSLPIGHSLFISLGMFVCCWAGLSAQTVKQFSFLLEITCTIHVLTLGGLLVDWNYCCDNSDNF